MKSRLNLDQLRAFMAVVRLGGFGRAAEELHLTQPAITTRIKNLEAALGTPLFDRKGSGVRLTKRGDLLARYATQYEQLAELVERDVIDPAGVERHLRLGVSETIAQSWLPLFVSRLHERYASIELEISVDISVNLREGLLNRNVDLAILLGPVSEYSIDNVELPAFDLAWYRGTGLVLPTEGDAGFLTRPIYTYARNTRPYRELQNALLQRVGPGARLFPSSSLSACFSLVEAGLGVAALPRALGQDLVAQGRITRFDPGWHPNPLVFTASYLGEPRSHMVETAAGIAQSAAKAYFDKEF